MKHLLLFLSFISFCNNAISQTYKPLIEKGDSWVLWYDWVAPDYTFIMSEKLSDDKFMLYEPVNQDTVFFGEVHISETNDTAWYYDYETQRRLEVFNLNLELGDSVLAYAGGSSYIHVDSVFTDTDGLKTIRFREGVFLSGWGEKNFFFKESFGPIGFFFFPEHEVFYHSWNPFMTCRLNDNKEVVYGVQNTRFKNCQFGNFSSISKQQKTNHQISINNGVLTVIPSCDEISIYNYLGQEIRNGKSTTLQINNLRPGTYILKIRSNESITNRTIFID